jgi:glycosyltransferase involved in cell wall biosynthesis
MNRLLSSYGLATLGVQYFPEAQAESPPHRSTAGLRGFFWPRTPSIDWKIIKGLIGDTAFDHLNIHWTPDIHGDLSEQVGQDELLSGRISISSWTGDREQYFHHLSQSNVFFASRTAEGIGMSFLEAMALGICVVAPNAPTMSEYIQHGVNGILYDPKSPAPVDFSRVRELGAAALVSTLQGRKAWIDSLPALKSFLEDKLPAYQRRAHPLISLKGRSIAQARKVYRFLKHVARKN